MPDFSLLGSLMRDLHLEFVRLYYLILPIFFCLSLIITWFKSPGAGVDFLDALKRAIIATFLLIAFKDISEAIVGIADGIAARIDDMTTLDHVIRMAEEKAKSYSNSPMTLLVQFNDLLIAVLSFASYLILYIARYLTIAMYHFFWIFLSVLAPLLILFTMFRSTSVITVNLFRSMIEIACWKIVWAVLSAMLKALAFGNAYAAEGSYITLIVMNFIIALAMLMTPMMVRSLVGNGIQSMATAISPAVVATMAAVPLKTAQTFRATRELVTNPVGFAKRQTQSFPRKGN